MLQSHFTFMAGLSFLYSFFNLYTTGGGQGVPTVEEAMMDIESCMAVLEYLTRKSSFLVSAPSSTPEPLFKFPLQRPCPPHLTHVPVPMLPLSSHDSGCGLQSYCLPLLRCFAPIILSHSCCLPPILSSVFPSSSASVLYIYRSLFVRGAAPRIPRNHQSAFEARDQIAPYTCCALVGMPSYIAFFPFPSSSAHLSTTLPTLGLGYSDEFQASLMVSLANPLFVPTSSDVADNQLEYRPPAHVTTQCKLSPRQSWTRSRNSTHLLGTLPSPPDLTLDKSIEACQSLHPETILFRKTLSQLPYPTSPSHTSLPYSIISSSTRWYPTTKLPITLAGPRTV